MNKTRIPIVIMTVALLSTAILALFTYHSTIKAMGSNTSSSGMGDLHLFEAMQNNTSIGAVERNNPYDGMGDLRRFEGQQNNRPYSGMGDLRRLEAQQNNASVRKGD